MTRFIGVDQVRVSVRRDMKVDVKFRPKSRARALAKRIQAYDMKLNDRHSRVLEFQAFLRVIIIRKRWLL